MCVNCDKARESVGAEIVRRTGVSAVDVEKVLLAMEAMQVEATEAMEKQEQDIRETVVEALRSGDTEALSRLFGGANVSVVEVDREGFPKPVPAHPIDTQEERLPGLYL